jgi:hypothetical protein
VPDSLTVDAATILAASSTLLSAANELPTNTPLEVTGCGSSAVVAAAESFNMWAKVTTQVMSDKLTEAGQDAQNAVTAYRKQDTSIADAVMTP